MEAVARRCLAEPRRLARLLSAKVQDQQQLNAEPETKNPEAPRAAWPSASSAPSRQMPARRDAWRCFSTCAQRAGVPRGPPGSSSCAAAARGGPHADGAHTRYDTAVEIFVHELDRIAGDGVVTCSPSHHPHPNPGSGGSAPRPRAANNPRGPCRFCASVTRARRPRCSRSSASSAGGSSCRSAGRAPPACAAPGGAAGGRARAAPPGWWLAFARVQLVRGEGRDVSSLYGEKDETCPVSTGKGGEGGVRRRVCDEAAQPDLPGAPVGARHVRWAHLVGRSSLDAAL